MEDDGGGGNVKIADCFPLRPAMLKSEAVSTYESYISV
ncbi:uncharacterized protein G2W53_028731 [Senna tora]|uniref:Uncharacterized protein n=1 Tax=Senna tora TaxID=362788 RepID=A0A834WA21_9FABA|nr:uncharacterized protein G2W53_028731 [Senna tora]